MEGSNQLDLGDETGWRHDQRRAEVPPVRPKLGTELIEEMQRQLKICVGLGTISLIDAAKLYGDWLTETPSVG